MAAISQPLPTLPNARTGWPTMWQVGAQAWPLIIKPNPRARRMALRIRPACAGQPQPAIQLTLPRRASIHTALAFLQSSSLWLARELDKQRSLQRVQPGCQLSVLDEPLTLHHTGQLRGLPRREGENLYLSGPIERFGARAAQYVQQCLLAYAQAEIAAFAAQLGVRVRSVRLKDMRSRWGSCSSEGDITLNWRLALAPRAVARYVIAHEIAHRCHMNHSPAFWSTVAQLVPNTPHARAWLNANSAMLHAWEF